MTPTRTQLPASPETSPATSVDPVDVEVVMNREQSILRRQSDTISNLSGQPLFQEISDLSCAVLDDTGDIINYEAFFIPHIGSLSTLVEAIIDEFDRNEIRPGDIFWCNDPYRGGTLHQSDNSTVAPVFDDGEIVCWVGDTAHITDVGGHSPGGFTPVPEDVVQEAVRVPPVKVYDAGEWQEGVFQLFLNNVRNAKRVGLDMKGLIGATHEAVKRMDELVNKYGGDYLRAIHRHVLDRSERQVREVLSELPDGTSYGRAYMESDHLTEDLYRIFCEATVDGDEIVVDFTNSSEQAPAGAINATWVGLYGGVGAMVATQLCADKPFTGGALRPVRIESEKGTIVDAEKPAPVSSGSITGTWYIMDAMLQALNTPLLASPYEDRVTGTWSVWSLFCYYCVNQHGDPWVSINYEGGSGGGGAFPQQDGEDLIGSSSTITARAPNIEGVEGKSPFLYLFNQYLTDSGGPGKNRGGNGIEAAFALHKEQSDGMEVTTCNNGKSVPGFGVAGGHPGGGAKIAKVQAPEAQEHLQNGEFTDWKETFETVQDLPTRDAYLNIDTEELMYIHTKGGGGYGDPLDRDPERVRRDVGQGQVSPEVARDVYGVVIDDGEVQTEETRARREKLRSQRGEKANQ